MILVIDNYDSFTYNLVHLIGALGGEYGETLDVKRNDAIGVDEALARAPRAIVLSPGPGTPETAGICIDLVRASAAANVPVFGVCLGVQSIAAAFGCKISRAEKLMHGKTSVIAHDGGPLFQSIPQKFQAARYHSLIADQSTLPAVLKVSATSDDDGEIMALNHTRAPIAGVQFHPESIASEHGAAIFRNFLDWSVERISGDGVAQ